MSNKLSISVCIPVYKGSGVLKRALNSIFRQNYLGEYEIVILDDNPTHQKQEILRTKSIISSFDSKKIKYYKNEKNLGSALTIQKLARLAKHDILTFLCQDDIFSKDALKKIVSSFKDESVGVLTRPFYWFENDIKKPIRRVLPPSSEKNSVISVLNCQDREIKLIFGSVGQISGLAYRKKFIERDFTSDIFPGHIYPFAEILKKYKCVFLKDYIVATSLKTSQTRFNSKIYETSPLQAWVKMFESVYAELQFEHVREVGINNIDTHYEGLVQIKNYGNMKVLFREIFLHLKYYPRSILRPKFWFYVFITIFTPRKLLIFLSDFYKRNILSRKIGNIYFNYYEVRDNLN